MELLQLLDAKAYKLKLPYLIVGGHAINAYGYSRQTGDLDVLVRSADLKKWKNFITTDLGYTLYHEQTAFAQFSPPVLEAWPIDLMLVNDKTFDKLFSASKEIVISGRIYRVPAIEHLVSMKLHALKQGDAERRLKDLTDVIQLLKQSSIGVHSDEFRQLCQKYATLEVYEEIKSIFTE